ncbi:MAG: cation:proton antiporter [Clostridia bacterium]|nr:cation:proton antiporter [Clostridia bacterium]
MDYGLIFDLAIILFACKVLSIFMRHLKIPQVVGQIVAGLLVGGNLLGLVEKSEPLVFMAEIGVLMLMFSAGLETDLKEIKSTGVISLLVAAMGVVVPLGGGYLLYSAFYGFAPVGDDSFWTAVFMGVIMTATSVGITVEVLRELGKLKSKVGTIILSAAIIDDVIGIVLLAFVSGLKNSSSGGSGEALMVIVRTILFFICSVVAGIVLHKLFYWLEKYRPHTRRVPIFSLVTCLLFSWAAEAIFGIADITGAFVAGVIIRTVKSASEDTTRKLDISSYMIFTPVFFASIGIKVTIELANITPLLLTFAVCFALVAMACKLGGCYLAGRLTGFKNKDSLRIGAGMMARGEVALIVATKGAEAGVLSSEFFIAVITLIIISSVLTPIALKLLYKTSEN